MKKGNLFEHMVYSPYLERVKCRPPASTRGVSNDTLKVKKNKITQVLHELYLDSALLLRASYAHNRIKLHSISLRIAQWKSQM